MRVERVVIGTVIFTVFSIASMGQKYMTMKPKNPIICYASSVNEHTQVEAPEEFLKWKRSKNARMKTSTIEVTYIGFSQQAKAAFQEAVDIWETQITSNVKIRVSATWEPLGQGVLGQAIWGSVHANFDGAQRMNTWYPAALAEKMANKELNDAAEFDIYADFNSDFDWYYGLTGIPGNGQYDLVSIVLHELGHGLGFVDSYSVQGNAGFVGVQSSGVPMIYDQFLENNTSGNIYHDFTSGTSALAAQLTSNKIFFNSPQVLAKTGEHAKIYAPTTYNGGSSIAHLDEFFYLAGDQNSLMTPQFGAAESMHGIGPIVLNAFSDMGWVFTFIEHEDLKDTENEDDPFVVRAKITSESGPIGQPKLHYSAGAPEVVVDMTPTGNPNEFEATIPATGTKTTYAYFISVTDGLSREYTRPGKLITPGQTQQQFYTVFTAGPDTEAPKITHSPKSFILNTDTELLVEAIVSDNLGLDQVKLQYRINGVPQSDIAMTSGTPDSLYSATLDFGSGLAIGDLLEYRILANDRSIANNAATNPATGYHQVNVTGLAPTRDWYANDFDTPSNDFFGDGYSITTPSGFTNPALHSNHPYSEGTGFPNDQLNLIYQLRVPIRVKAVEATIKFDEVVLVEPGEPGSVFGSDDFYDYVVVEGSKDGGLTWTPVAAGYDSRSYSEWLTKYNSSSSGNNSTGVGTAALYRPRIIDLQNKFDTGDEVTIRFRLFSDPFAAGWGWAIDNLRIQVDETPPLILHDHFDYLTADVDNMPLTVKVTEVTEVRDLSIEIQVNGGSIQTEDLPVSPNVELYTLNVDVSSLNPGDLLMYRIISHDTSNNEGAFPPTGFINVNILNTETAVSEYTNNFNAVSTDFFGNFFSITKPSGFSDNAINSDHFYSNGRGLDNTSSYSYILKKPVKLNASNPYIRFDEIAIVQPQSSSIAFGTAAFNDYVIVEGSDDGGVTWKMFAKGYDAVAQTTWLNIFNGGNDPTPSSYKRRLINMLDNGNFQAGDDVMIRFRLYADATSNGWGWAIDNLSIQGAVTGTDDIAESSFKVYPNPANEVVNVEFPATGSQVNVKLLNIQGQVLQSREETPANGTVRSAIDMSQLREGLYLIKAESGGKTITRKVLKAGK